MKFLKNSTKRQKKNSLTEVKRPKFKIIKSERFTEDGTGLEVHITSGKYKDIKFVYHNMAMPGEHIRLYASVTENPGYDVDTYFDDFQAVAAKIFEYCLDHQEIIEDAYSD